MGSEFHAGRSWIGDLPPEWVGIRAKRVFAQSKAKALEGDEQLSVTQKSGVIRQAELLDDGQRVVLALSGTESFKHVEVDDFVISLRSFQGGIEWSRVFGCVSPAYTVLRASKSIYPAYWAYLLKSTVFIAAMRSVIDEGIRDGKSITYEQFGEAEVPFPHVDVQRKIARFLDVSTGRIDWLIARKTRFIELLREKRQALITHAVTKGLDPSVPMKDSGVEWLGKIPATWKVLPLKRDIAFLTSGSRGWAEHYSEKGPIFIRIGNLRRRDFRLDLSDIQRVEPPDGAEGARTRVASGDLLFSITAYLGSVGVVPDDLEAAYVSQHVALVRLSRRLLLPDWAAYVAISWIGATYLSSQGYGGTKVQLGLEDIAEMPMTIPPLDEQAAITSYLMRATDRMDALVSKTERSIELLREHRTALITAAVTGKIDLREYAASSASSPSPASVPA